MQRRRHHGYAWVLIALTAVAFVVFLASRSPEDADEVAGAGAGRALLDRPASTPVLVGAPPPDADASPAESASSEPPAPAAVPPGAVRITVRAPFRRAGDGTTVRVQILGEAGRGGALVWTPGGSPPWSVDSLGGLGPRARAEPESGSPDASGSILLFDVEAGTYSFRAFGVSSANWVSAPAAAAVGSEGVTVLLELLKSSAVLRVRATQAGESVRSNVRVAGAAFPLHEGSSDEEHGPFPVPADEDLEVSVLSFPGSDEFGLPPPQRVRLAPGERAEVSFELVPGVLLSVRATREGRAVQSRLSLWRFQTPERAIPVYHLRHTPTGARVGRVLAGRYFARVQHEAGTGQATFDVAAPGPIEVTVPLRAEGTRMRIRIVESDGVPAAGVEFALGLASPANVEGSWSWYLATDGDGLATSPPAPPGRYGLWFWTRGLHRPLEVVEGPSELVLLHLPPKGPRGNAGLRGTVRLPSGGSAHGMFVVLAAVRDPWEDLVEVNSGAFAVTGLAPGLRTLRIPRSAYSREWYRPHEQVISLHDDDDNHVDVVLESP